MQKPTADTTSRVVTEVPPPIASPLENVWLEGGKPNLDALRQHFTGEGRLHDADAAEIVRRATKIFKAEPNLLEVPQPVTGKRPLC
jgi:hypothetical protein